MRTKPRLTPPTELPAWKALTAYHPRRGERLTAEAVGLYLDYSKNRIMDAMLQLFVQLALLSAMRFQFGGHVEKPEEK